MELSIQSLPRARFFKSGGVGEQCVCEANASTVEAERGKPYKRSVTTLLSYIVVLLYHTTILQFDVKFDVKICWSNYGM